MTSRVLAFLRSETAGGLLLMLAAAVAVMWANSPGRAAYGQLLHLPVGVTVGQNAMRADLHFVVNDMLMALFFLLVGLEIRHEMSAGELASVRRAAAPAVAALGGMVAPALIYLACTAGDPSAQRGWAIPTATDIAFSLAVLRLLGPGVPGGLRVFLTALAIIDDLGAILIIALFFSADLSLTMLGAAALVWVVMFGLSRSGVRNTPVYLLGFALLWACLVRSGVHATLAGVAAAFAVPMRSVGYRLEHALRGFVAFGVLPLFALFNAGLSFGDIEPAKLLDPVVPGIALGLLVGKPLGVFGAAWLATRVRLTTMPAGLDGRMVLGAAALCGIGFTMSLFIGLLAFPDGARVTELKIAVFAGSIASAVLGACILNQTTRRSSSRQAG